MTKTEPGGAAAAAAGGWMERGTVDLRLERRGRGTGRWARLHVRRLGCPHGIRVRGVGGVDLLFVLVSCRFAGDGCVVLIYCFGLIARYMVDSFRV